MSVYLPRELFHLPRAKGNLEFRALNSLFDGDTDKIGVDVSFGFMYWDFPTIKTNDDPSTLAQFGPILGNLHLKG